MHTQKAVLPEAPFASKRRKVMLLATADAPMRTAENPATQQHRGRIRSHVRRCTFNQLDILRLPRGLSLHLTDASQIWQCPVTAGTPSKLTTKQ